MNTHVDVLAVLDNIAEVFPMFASIGGLTYSRPDVREARAALAELIAADKEYDDACEAARGFIDEAYEEDSYGVEGSQFYRCLACDGESGAGLLNKGVTHEPNCVRQRYEQALQRRAAALARIGGAS